MRMERVLSSASNLDPRDLYGDDEGDLKPLDFTNPIFSSTALDRSSHHMSSKMSSMSVGGEHVGIELQVMCKSNKGLDGPREQDASATDGAVTQGNDKDND